MRSVLTACHLHQRQSDRRQHQPIGHVIKLLAQIKQVHSENDPSLLYRPAPRRTSRLISRTLRQQPKPTGLKGPVTANHALLNRHHWHLALDRQLNDGHAHYGVLHSLNNEPEHDIH
jgi:hypothetical protein